MVRLNVITSLLISYTLCVLVFLYFTNEPRESMRVKLVTVILVKQKKVIMCWVEGQVGRFPSRRGGGKDAMGMERWPALLL